MDSSSASRPASTANDGHDSSEVLVTVAIDDYSGLVDVAADEGVQIEKLEHRNLVDPASISVILIGTSLAVSTVVHIVEMRKGGQVFDSRPGASRPAYRSKDIAYGYVQIIAMDGSITVEVKEPRGMFGQVLDTLALLVKESIGSPSAPLQERVADVLGDAASIRAST